MVNRRNLLIGIGLGLAATVGTGAYLARAEQAVWIGRRTITVVTAKRAVPAFSRLENVDLEMRQVPAVTMLPGAVRYFGELRGRITTVPLVAGEQVLRSKTARVGEKAGLADRLGPGERGVTVSVGDDGNVARTVTAGDAVDVLCVLDLGDGERRATTLLQEVRVIELLSSPDGGASAARVVLAVTPAQAQAIALAEQSGELRVALRGATESGQTRLPATGLADLAPAALEVPVRQVSAPALRPAARNIEVIKGVELERSQFVVGGGTRGW